MKQGTAFLNAYVQPYKKKRVRLLAMAVLQVLCDIGVSLALKSIIDRALLRGSRVLPDLKKGDGVNVGTGVLLCPETEDSVADQ